MTSQGFFGALWQYWNISEKPRLNRRNTYVDDQLDKVTNQDALVFCICSVFLMLAVISSWLIISALMGMIL